MALWLRLAGGTFECNGCLRLVVVGHITRCTRACSVHCTAHGGAHGGAHGTGQSPRVLISEPRDPTPPKCEGNGYPRTAEVPASRGLWTSDYSEGSREEE